MLLKGRVIGTGQYPENEKPGKPDIQTQHGLAFQLAPILGNRLISGTYTLSSLRRNPHSLTSPCEVHQVCGWALASRRVENFNSFSQRHNI
jgi:hypothetical protein